MANIINGTDTGSGGLITTGDSSDELQLQTAETARVTLTNTAVVVNEGGNDVDFRVESDTVDHALFVEGSSGNVGIGTSAPASLSGYTTLGINNATNGGILDLMQNGSMRMRLIGLAGSGVIETASSLPILFAPAGSEAMRIDSSGNVGIGVTPSSWNSVYRAVQLPFGTSLTGRTDTDETLLASNTYRDSGGFKYFGTGSATSYFQTGGQHLWYAAASGTAGNAISWTERMRIDSSGNVGIGTSSPSGKLGIQGASGQNAYIECGGNGNTLGSTSALFGQNDTSIAYCWNRANAALLFGTNGTERMRIDSSGNLLVNTTTANGTVTIRGTTSPTQPALYVKSYPTSNPTSYIYRDNTDAQAALAVRHDATIGGGTAIQIQFRDQVDATVGSITSTSTATAYNTSSDYRLKENVAPMTGALAKVLELNPVTYTWKVDGSAGEGFIAHELQEVAPYAVSGEKDGEQMQGVDYGKITPLLTAALQEAIAEIQSLKARVAELEAK